LRVSNRSRKLVKVFVGEVGIFTRRHPDTVRGADVAYLSNEPYERLGCVFRAIVSRDSGRS
jgi:hypothetical protein